MQNSKKCPPNLITFFEDMLNLVFQMGKSEMERKGNFGPSYLSFPVPFRPFQINPAFLSLSEKNGQLSGKGNIAFLSLTCMAYTGTHRIHSTHNQHGWKSSLCVPCPPAAPCSKKKLLLNFLSHEKKAITNVVIAMFICCDADIHVNCML